jgi:hypothetical protein
MVKKEINIAKLMKEIDESKPLCICGKHLKGSGVDWYAPHSGGVYIDCETQKAWVYITCQCGYDVALWKIQNEINLQKCEQLNEGGFIMEALPSG